MDKTGEVQFAPWGTDTCARPLSGFFAEERLRLKIHKPEFEKTASAAR